MFRIERFGDISTASLAATFRDAGLPGGLPLIVDGFAGGGGTSEGIRMALGRSPDIAINHSAPALALHAANHPETLHLSENIFQVDPLDFVKGRHVGLSHFSPDCKDFSKAKGGTPVQRNIRDLAWVVVLWAERAKPDVITLENVEEFQEWGPLLDTEKGLMPDPDRRGDTYQKWCRALRRLGYRLQKRELRACDYGAPTIRKRLYLIARRDGKKIIWPKPTHGKPTDRDVIAGRKLPWRTAAECIDWTLPCPSIFDSRAQIKAKYGLSSVRPLADATMSRVARGMKRYVLDADRPFLVNLTHGARIEDLAEPFNTITGANRGEKAVVAPHVMTMRNSGKPFNGADEPVHTITAGGAGLTLVAPVLTAAQHGGSNRSIENPHHTITASQKDQNSVIIPTLVGCGGRAGQSRPRGGDEPLATITSKADGCVAVAYMAQHNNDSRRDGGVNPGRPLDVPMSTITQSGSQQNIVTAFVARQFGASVGHSIDEPSATVTAGVNKSQLVTPYLSHLYTSNTAGGQGDPEVPLKTITAGGGHASLVAPYLQKYYGTGDGARYDEPGHTVTVKDRFGHVETLLAVPPVTSDQEERAREVASFMRAHGFWDDREFVTLNVGDQTFVIVDIGMRMLTPRELYNAQGFPPDYIIDGGWQHPKDGGDPEWVTFSKSVQVSCVGNSVSPPVMAAIISANCGHLRMPEARAA